MMHFRKQQTFGMLRDYSPAPSAYGRNSEFKHLPKLPQGIQLQSQGWNSGLTKYSKN